MSPEIDQSKASAQGDIVAGDKTTHHHHYSAEHSSNTVRQLLHRLETEMENNEQIRDTIERLQRFYEPRSHDGVVGLEAKLKAGKRESEITDALERKEMFVKILDQWSLYASAQEIFAHLLARAEYEFNFFIRPRISDLNNVQVNQLMNDRIVAPTVSDCGSSVFSIDHNIAMGMIYWLAEQCFVRWHK